MRAAARLIVAASVAFACALALALSRPAPAQAFNPIGTVCTVAGWVSGIGGAACENAKGALSVGKSLVTGHIASAVAGFGLVAVGAWVTVGARRLLGYASAAIQATTTPQLAAHWFSAEYLRMAAIGALLTIPFLMAAAVQAIIRSDLALLTHAAFVSLPVALLLVAVAAPLTMLLLAATDEMCGLIAGASGNAGAAFLGRVAGLFSAVAVGTDSPFVAFLVGFVAALGALAVWIELVMREAAVYIVVLMLPLVFAAFVWPARRMWAVRLVELLLALILAKFAIVAVISLGGAALNALNGMSGMVAGAVLVLLAAFMPWAVTRLLPLTESAAAAGGSLREGWEHAKTHVRDAHGRALGAEERVRDFAGAARDGTGREAAVALVERLGRNGRAEAVTGTDPAPSEAVAGSNRGADGGGPPADGGGAPADGGGPPADEGAGAPDGTPPTDARERRLEGLPDVFREPHQSRTYRFDADELVPPGSIEPDDVLPSARADGDDETRPGEDRDPLPPPDGPDPLQPDDGPGAGR